MFVAGYNELCRMDLNGCKVLEVCSGSGDLALRLGRVFPNAEIFAMDRYPAAGDAIRQTRAAGTQLNVHYLCGDALSLSDINDGSLDLVYGQATLHHLAHDTQRLGAEMARVLKPGGRLVFIYEPFGHNAIFAMVRAYRIARVRMVDESNVVLPQLEEIAQAFRACDVHPFNFIGYPIKSFGRFAGARISSGIYKLDRALMRMSERFASWAANFNAIFTK